MSINVTVNGNPIRIKKGKMVTADSDYSKGEMDKRRKMRLAQVRQQSDEIAAKVRKRVQKERKTQETNVEKKEAENLEEWKTQRLLELQEQYCDCLKNIGLGHAQAIIEEAKEQVEREFKEALMEKCKQRGHQAAKKLHREQEEKEMNKKKEKKEFEERKQSIKTIKNPVRKKKKRKKGHREDNFIDYSPNESLIDESDSESSNSDENEVENDDEVNSYENNQDIYVVIDDNRVNRGNSPLKGTKSPIESSKSVQSRSPSLRSPSPPKLADIIIHHPPDTRISDRIKNRRLPPYKDPILEENIDKNFEKDIQKDNQKGDQKGKQKESFLNNEKEEPIKLMVSTGTLTEGEKDCLCCCKCKCINRNIKEGKNDFFEEKNVSSKKSGMKSIGTVTENQFPLKIQTVKCDCCSCKDLIKEKKAPSRNLSPKKYKNEIPSKPTVVLKQKSKTEIDKVQFYDYKNRFGKEYLPPDNQVQKIPDSDIEILPQTQTDNDLIEFNQKREKEAQIRDKEAQIRGKKAMEKEKIQKDYKELLEKLPALQRQERIASLATKSSINQSFHMSDTRLKQQELKKQCKMEDAYEKLFPHTITLKPKVTEDKPFKVIESKVPDESKNPYYWDVVEQNEVVLTKEDGIITINPNVSDQTDNLKAMLEKLRKQKEMLMKEVETLPRDSNLDSIIDDLERFRNNEVRGSENMEKNFGDSEFIGFKSNNLKDNKIPKKIHSKTHSKTHKHKKCHRVHKVLQNTSTQTSPKVTIQTNSDEIKSKNEKFDKSKNEKFEKSKKDKSYKSKTSKFLEKPILEKSILEKPNLEKPSSEKTNSEKSSSLKLSQPEINQSVKHPCNCCASCQKNDVCEIVIKIQDDIPQINIKSPKKTKIETTSSKTSNQSENISHPGKKTSSQTNSILTERERKPKSDSKLSWSKTLTPGTPGEPSTSTSYYSPPDFPNRPQISQRKETLLKYIKKLLTMSRKSIENLQSSDVSSIESTISSLSNPSAASFALKLLEASLQNMEKQINNSTSTNSVKSVDYDPSISNSNNKHEENHLNVAEKYHCIAEQCHQRISNLTAMIEQVRKEKEQILSPLSDKEASTAYLKLPSSIGEENKSSSILSENESDKEQAILNKLLLDVNINLDKMKEQTVRFETKSNSPPIDPEVYQRYKNLMEVEEKKFSPETNLLNIPKLPKLKPHFAPNIDEKPKKPPPAKGLTAAKKFNGEITNVPHELSTIAEVDSQLSTKANEMDQIPILILPSPPREKHISEESMPDIVAEIRGSESSSSVSEGRGKQTDKSTSSDMENLEAMLASMGMGWAIATLRKTQAALVQAASSTSSEDRKKNKDGSDTSTSDVTLRDFLGEKMFSTSSTQCTSHSLSPFMRDLEEISVIKGSGYSSELKRQRTSTPVGLYIDLSVDKKKNSREINNSSKVSDEAFVTLPDAEKSD